MIINALYFTNDIYIPQVGSDVSRVANSNIKIQEFIDEYEPEILEKALGISLYEEFSSNLQSHGILKEDADQKWNALLNGLEYTKDGVQHYWRGIVRERRERKMSFIAYYVYYKFMLDGVEQTSTQGVVKSKAKNAQPVSAIPKLTNAWRKMHEWYGGSETNGAVYKGWVKGVWFEDYFNGANNTKEVSLYRFLTDHKSDYQNWNFTPIENKNEWGI